MATQLHVLKIPLCVHSELRGKNRFSLFFSTLKTFQYNILNVENVANENWEIYPAQQNKNALMNSDVTTNICES